MTGRLGVRALAVLLALAPLACADGASLPVAAGYGPDPALPEPEHSLVPTIEVAKARGWVAVDAGDALLVADDVGNAVWRVTPSGSLAGR